jgi:hypothetical protein
MDINNVPEPFKSRIKDLFQNKPYGEDVNSWVDSCLSDAADWDEAKDMIFNDFQSRIDEARKIQDHLTKE